VEELKTSKITAINTTKAVLVGVSTRDRAFRAAVAALIRCYWCKMLRKMILEI
jgi:hypothetical protein